MMGEFEYTYSTYIFIIMLFVVLYAAFKIGQMDGRKEEIIMKKKEVRKAVAYMRVSKSEEEIENQRIALKEYAEKNNIDIVAEFEDEDVSGWKIPVLKRKGFQDLLNYLQNNNGNIILFYDVTRFGRSWKDVMSTYYALEEEGYTLYFALQPYISREVISKMFESMPEPLRTYMIETTLHEALYNSAKAAEFEVVLGSVRIRAGQKRAKLQGKKIGGYQLPDWVIEEIRKLLQEGYTYDEIQEMVTYTTSKKKKEKHPSRALIARIAKEMREGSE